MYRSWEHALHKGLAAWPHQGQCRDSTAEGSPFFLVPLGTGSQAAAEEGETQVGLALTHESCFSAEHLLLGLCLIHCSHHTSASSGVLLIQTQTTAYGLLATLTPAPFLLLRVGDVTDSCNCYAPGQGMG